MAGAVANRNRREALRGAEEGILDLLAEVLTSKQWVELLKAPLERASAKGNRGLAQKLVRAGAEIGNALHAAAQGGHAEIGNDLLENGAPVDAKNTGGNTPLHFAAGVGKTEMVHLLLLKGADKDALNSPRYTPLYLAGLNGHVAAALALLAAGADISLQCGGGNRSIVHAAAQGEREEILRATIGRGADVDAMNSDQQTALHFAALENKAKAIDVLVENGANIEAQDTAGWTPLHEATSQFNMEALLVLLKHGAHVNAEDEEGETPLFLATVNAGRRGAAKLVDVLLRSGADETILNGEGKAAADVVAEGVLEEDQLAEDVERVCELLANAPTDRAWRRRGYLVCCRAHPARMERVDGSNSALAGKAGSTGSGAKLARREASGCTGTVGGGTVDERGGSDWAIVVARVLELQEEGIFRTIVGYL